MESLRRGIANIPPSSTVCPGERIFSNKRGEGNVTLALPPWCWILHPLFLFNSHPSRVLAIGSSSFAVNVNPFLCYTKTVRLFN